MSWKIIGGTPQIKHAGSAGVRASVRPSREIYATLGYDRPTVWSGLGSVLDVGGTFGRGDKIRGVREVDRRAMASDWYAIGADLFRSTKAFASRRSVKAGHGKSKQPG